MRRDAPARAFALATARIASRDSVRDVRRARSHVEGARRNDDTSARAHSRRRRTPTRASTREH